MKRILVIAPSPRDYRELGIHTVSKQDEIHFQSYDTQKVDKLLCIHQKGEIQKYSPREEIEQLLQYCAVHAIDAIVSTEDYPGCIFSSIVAHELGLPGPSPQSVLTCQHKYYSRVTQKQFVPSATPEFMLIKPGQQIFSNQISFPLFAKPVKSYFSIFANTVNNKNELQHAANAAMPSDAYLEPLNWFINHYSSFELDAKYLLAESLLIGEQVTVEGYVFNHHVEIMGVVDSIMYPGTICFERFDYPSKLEPAIQDVMATIAVECIKGIKLNNTLFNIEMMYNPQTNDVFIIEVNPRMSSQFADLFEKVDGVNSYQILLALAKGEKPHFKKNEGKYKTSASFVLRRFDNKMVIKSPTKEAIKEVSEQFADSRIEIFAIEGQDLGAFKQDGKSFRYGLIHLGAQNKEALFHKFELCKQKLPIHFSDTQ